MIWSFLTILSSLFFRTYWERTLVLELDPVSLAWLSQLQSLIEAVGGLVLAGLAPGLTVLIAQSKDLQYQRQLLSMAIIMMFFITIPLACVIFFINLSGALVIFQGGLTPLFLLAIASPALSLVNAYWAGDGAHRLIFISTFLVGVMLSIAMLYVNSSYYWILILGYPIVLGLGLVVYLIDWRIQRQTFYRLCGSFNSYILPGMVIGLLSPLSMFLFRHVSMSSLGVDKTAYVQAVWRSSEWVTALAGGVLTWVILPQLSAVQSVGAFKSTLLDGFLKVVLPSMLLLIVMPHILGSELLIFLYGYQFDVSIDALRYLWLGDACRVFSWLLLFCLYAQKKTWRIVMGEFVSLPMFVFIVWINQDHLTIELIGIYWLITYALYSMFNLWMVRDCTSTIAITVTKRY